MRTGFANLPLHTGKAPAWLFKRMVALSRGITEYMVSEFGPDDVLKKLSDPFWFQSLGCVLGFDWHSSGVTTTVCGALKEGIRGLEGDLGLFIAGGKGARSRNTPFQIVEYAEKYSLPVDTHQLVYASRMSAKVDSAAIQDGYQIYQHSFFFTKSGLWTVVQQGMNEAERFARRYHWLSAGVSDFVNEPHSAICSEQRGQLTLNLVAKESDPARSVTAEIAHDENPDKLVGELKKLQTLNLPKRHEVMVQDLHPDSLRRVLIKAYEGQPENFEQLLGTEGVGPAAIRALSLISELVYGVPPSFRDPAKFSFAHGGKDGTPFPVDRKTYDQSIEVLRKAVRASKLGQTEETSAFRRLAAFEKEG